MAPDTLAIMAFTGFLASGLGALVWTRLNRIEDHVAQSARREDMEALRAEMVAVRSDLTQIALAVGADQRRASQG